MKPFSAFYYIKQNKARACTAAIMFALCMMLMMGGNFIMSTMWAFDQSAGKLDQFITAMVLSTDEKRQDWKAFLSEVDADPDLQIFHGSGYGHGSMEYGTALGVTASGNVMVFTVREEMEEAFRIMGIDIDTSKVQDHGLVLSSMYAKGAEGVGVAEGDVVDPSFSSAFDTEYTVDAIYEGNDNIQFYFIPSEVQATGRVYIHGKNMDHEQLKQRLLEIRGDGKIALYTKTAKENFEEFFSIFRIIFYVSILLIGIILSVTISSWFTGHFMKRTYEFGVYRAVGRSRKEVRHKIAAEILIQDLIGITVGLAIVLLSTFLLNELAFVPKGKYLPYVSDMGILGAVVSNLLAVIPLIFFKSRAMNRADVTEF